MTVQCGATEFSWLPGFSRHTWPTAADDRRGSHLFYASHKRGSSDHPPRAWPTPRLPRDRPAGRAGVQRVAPAADTRTPGGSGGQAASAPAVSGVGAGSFGANRRTAGAPEAAGARRARAAATGRARRTHGLTDRRTPRDGDWGGGPQSPAPKARAQAPPGGSKPAGEGATAQPGLRGRVFSGRPGRHPRSVSPATRGPSRRPAFLHGFWSLPLAVLLAPPPRPPGCQGNPSDACRGQEALGGAAAAPRARPLGAREQLTMEPQSKGAGAGGPGPPGNEGGRPARGRRL
ncbi:PREDICTED: uncharacterized protein LOC101367462 [Odobenus rosmarus divergens]|uniref:Uncharacterized protein LOC101367462 n=1 Tax=Odobenus rosmarus divergens TaxID=9708 RepID=A0A9B0GQK1_ODORO